MNAAWLPLGEFVRARRMPRNVGRWMWKHRKLTSCLFATIAVSALNAVAFNQAWSMTHFAVSGQKTAAPESLSFLAKIRTCVVGVTIPRPENQIDPHVVGLEFDTCRFGGTDGSELEAWHVPCANAKGLVLMVHGYGACKSSVLPEAKAVHDWGYAVFLLDFHGSGGSRGSTTSIGVREADDVARAVEYVRAKMPSRTLILYGQSMGSAAILRAVAVNGIAPTAVIVECPFDRLISTAGNRFAAMGLPAFPGAHLVVFWGGVQQGFNGFHHEPAEYARRVVCPVLLMQGTKDARVTLVQAKSIYDNFPAKKRFVHFTDAGHESYLAAAPATWRKAVLQFLDGLDPAEELPDVLQ